MIDYVEVEGVLYRETEAYKGEVIFGEMLQDGKWVPAFEPWKASSFGSPMTEEEAKDFAGADWPG